MLVLLLISSVCFAKEQPNSLYSKSLEEIADILSPGICMAHSEQERISMLALVKSMEEDFELPAYFAIVADSLELNFNIVPRVILEQCLLTLKFLPDIELIKKACNKCQEELLETVESLICCMDSILHDENNYLTGQALVDKAMQHPAFFMRQVECISRVGVTINTGISQVPGGSASTPSYTFNSDNDTGMYSAIANQVGIAGNGGEILLLTGTASAINEFTITNAALGNDPSFAATGDDTNIGIDITSKATGAISLKGGAIEIQNNTTSSAGELRLYEASDNGTNYTSFKTVADQSFGNINYTLPPNDGTSGQLLSTDGVGVLTWATAAGSGDVVGPSSATDNAIARFDTTTGKLIQNSEVTIADGGNMTLETSTAAREIAMARNTAAAAGQGLTINAGGTLAGQTNLNGGDLTLKSGISTGTGSSSVVIKAAGAGSTGTADNTPLTVLTINGTASAVNSIIIKNNVSGSAPRIISTGSDTNVGMLFETQLAGQMVFQTNGSDALIIDIDGDLLMQRAAGQVLARTDALAATPAYAFNGDEDTGIYRSAANTVAIAGQGNNVFEVDGTTASSVNFIKVKSTATGAGPQISSIGSDTDVGLFIKTQNVGDMIFQTGSTTRMSIAASTGIVNVVGEFTAGTKTFKIDHPDPEKTDTYYLQHSVVETPTGGDNLYRYTIVVPIGENTASASLPSYWKHLNKDPQVWVTPYEHFGIGWGKINETEDEVVIHCNTPGTYEVLILATRKDVLAEKTWQGAETLKANKKWKIEQ